MVSYGASWSSLPNNEIELEQRYRLEHDSLLMLHFVAHPVTSMPMTRMEEVTWTTVLDEKYCTIRTLEVLLARSRKLRSIDIVAHDDYFFDEVFTPIRDKHLHDPNFRDFFKRNNTTFLIRQSHRVTHYTAVHYIRSEADSVGLCWC